MISGSNSLVAVNRRNGSRRPAVLVRDRQMAASTPVLQMLLAEVALLRQEVNSVVDVSRTYPVPTRLPEQQQIVIPGNSVEVDRMKKIFD